MSLLKIVGEQFPPLQRACLEMTKPDKPEMILSQKVNTEMGHSGEKYFHGTEMPKISVL